ncbi:hypothetical protein A2673_00955 [Candidatus Kaiserbacteria bacterium RIFCSPHIGHO2_01_FULL_50_13]|uniref:Uncharacterized protein n=1 Tax=Candidatus Kaiserbacteria bacterium RIFCSPLOWO2_01_FULL_50_24 TaxID=1798507 RepID=A0A1F6EMS7_9BACT|nr:MAG: hypothetical protein A2673_00955 [Candidatus Kaiserbacteria bacterium RIFCSPHIGHO2_01_FULL_50_13]OGG74954.1 MAG: hypothetical protein A3A34_04015 [Candidatus Kaiserbacteria bacterium RIFCSPLOWO2_01_FULL_50_24]OGG81756.1 MAG: hypothetical protein A3H74_01090 [Candidatus Kaiserbacteria bacterium RIFCSPLOWO2_02_FULL_51_13]
MPEKFSAETYKKDFESKDSCNARIKHILSYAIRAPSTHNSQPWKFILTGNRLSIINDESIRLPKSDALGRYRHISFGYLIHHIVLLAAYSGTQTMTRLGRAPVIAEIEFHTQHGVFDVTIAPLINALCSRRNRRGIFERDSAIPHNTLEAASARSPLFPAALAKPECAIASGRTVACIASCTAEGMRRAYRSNAFRREMASWITPTGSWRKTGIPGYSLNQPAILSWLLPNIIRFIDIGRFLSKLNVTSISSAPCVFGFAGDDTVSSWIGVGFQASHTALTLTAARFDVSVYVAAMEYDDTRREAGRAFGFSHPLQFLFATGALKGNVSWCTPRVPVSQKLTER